MKKICKKRTYSKRLYQIIGIILSCFVLIFASYGITLAWFVDQSVTSNGEPNILVVGTVDLNVETNFNFYNLVLAPDTVYTSNIEDGKTVNYATRLTTATKNDTGNIYVRAKFETNRDELSLYFNNLTTTNTYSEGLVGMWYYNEEIDTNDDGVADSGDGFYYYIGSVGTTEVIFNAGYYVDNTLDNSKAGEEVTINFVFESIQRPYGAYHAVWDTAPTVFDQFASLDSGYTPPVVEG